MTVSDVTKDSSAIVNYRLNASIIFSTKMSASIINQDAFEYDSGSYSLSGVEVTANSISITTSFSAEDAVGLWSCDVMGAHTDGLNAASDQIDLSSYCTGIFLCILYFNLFFVQVSKFFSDNDVVALILILLKILLATMLE